MSRRQKRFWINGMTEDECIMFGLPYYKLRQREKYMYLCPACVAKLASAGFHPLAVYLNQSDWCEMCEETHVNRQLVNHMYFNVTKKEWDAHERNPFKLEQEHLGEKAPKHDLPWCEA